MAQENGYQRYLLFNQPMLQTGLLQCTSAEQHSLCYAIKTTKTKQTEPPIMQRTKEKIVTITEELNHTKSRQPAERRRGFFTLCSIL
jgi:hypothetical protein